jgi:hypothetical protein
VIAPATDARDDTHGLNAQAMLKEVEGLSASDD